MSQKKPLPFPRALVPALLCTLVLTSGQALADEGEPIPPVAPPRTGQQAEEGLTARFNSGLEKFNSLVADTLFFSVTGDLVTAPEFDKRGKPVLDEDGAQKRVAVRFPFIVALLVGGGLFFTFFYRFVNIRGFRHAIDVVRGKFDNPTDEGDVSHFRAFTSALSATVGLGNIAGVAIAIQIGGPGAMLWMIVAAFFGMSLKFNSCSLSQMFRKTNPDGSVSGGPMYYLEYGLRRLNQDGPLSYLGKALGILYAFMIIGGSFGGGNMFQANQSFGAMQAAFDAPQQLSHGFGIALAVLVGMVIIGGIRRIGAATSRIVPSMVGLYILASLYIILANISEIPHALTLVCSMAFSGNAVYGGTLGVIVKGFQRASFSNEAGIGSAAIAHAAAKTEEPVREGLVAMLGPVVDTVIVCSMTALVVIITGAWNDPNLTDAGGDLAGVALTSAAFGSQVSWFPAVLTVCVLMFAYSTMISWAYYGERGWIYLMDHLYPGFGHRSLVGYRVIFVFFVYYGSITKLDHVLLFSDLMILCMALPNILGGVILAPTVKAAVNDYWRRWQAGEFGRPSP
jgi:alanine or glycine:cation symporter, AGCS family